MHDAHVWSARILFLLGAIGAAAGCGAARPAAPDAPAAASSPAPRSPSMTAPRDVPLSLFLGRWGIVDVRVGDAPARFVVDTGANRTLVDRTLAAARGWPITECRSIPGAMIGELCKVHIPSIELFGRTLPGVETFASDFARSELGESLEADGLLGGDYLSQFVLVIDYPRARWSLVDPERFTPPAVPAIPVVLKSGGVFVPVQVAGSAASFFLDTGNGGRTIVLDVPAQASLAPAKSRDFLLSGAIRSGAGGSADATPCRGELRIGDVVVPDAQLFVASAREGTVMGKMQGILGVGLLRYFRMTLDYPRARLYLEQALPFPKAEDDATYGVVARARDGRLEIASVDRSGPAARAGLRQGDVITSIDGVRVDRNAAVLWPELTPRSPSATTTLEVARASEVRTVTLRAVAVP